MARAIFLPLLLGLLFFTGCKSADNNTVDENAPEFVEYNNPPAEGFNAEGSDAIAILLADQVMNAMGGREKWDNTNVIYWNFLGNRTLLWDKQNNRVRVDIPSREVTIALNMDDMTGKVWKSGEELTSPDSLSKYLEQGHRMWINDSYWLVMPFKLKDSGVTLKYLREDTTMVGESADVLGLTFEEVGVTPQNGYEVWVDTDDRLIRQWAFFRDASQDEPNFVLPWTDYKNYDGLLLSGERGDRDLTEIKVLDEVPRGAFENSQFRF